MRFLPRMRDGWRYAVFIRERKEKGLTVAMRLMVGMKGRNAAQAMACDGERQKRRKPNPIDAEPRHGLRLYIRPLGAAIFQFLHPHARVSAAIQPR